MTQHGKQLMNSETVSPELAIAYELHDLCQESIETLAHLIEHMQEPQRRQKLRLVMETRNKIIRQLANEHLLDSRFHQRNAFGSSVAKFRALRQEKIHRVEESLQAFEQTDRSALQELRQAFKAVRDMQVACRLSSLIATFQISSDQLRATGTTQS